jgi:hypothetical protein
MTLGYLDPGSGSLIASAVVGGLAGAAVAAKQVRHRLTSKFSRKRPEADANPTDAAPESEQTPSEP